MAKVPSTVEQETTIEDLKLGIGTQYDISGQISGGSVLTVPSAYAVVYRTMDGQWRMRFNIRITQALSTGMTIPIAGVTFATDSRQAITAMSQTGGSDNLQTAYALNNTGSLLASFGPDGADTVDDPIASGDVRITARPSWAV